MPKPLPTPPRNTALRMEQHVARELGLSKYLLRQVAGKAGVHPIRLSDTVRARVHYRQSDVQAIRDFLSVGGKA